MRSNTELQTFERFGVFHLCKVVFVACALGCPLLAQLGLQESALNRHFLRRVVRWPTAIHWVGLEHWIARSL